MDDKTLLHLKQSFACLLASQVHGGRKKILAAHVDSDVLQRGERQNRVGHRFQPVSESAVENGFA
jgi:hypothetical protein